MAEKHIGASKCCHVCSNNEQIIDYVDSLMKSSFEGWTKEEENAYKTACLSIKRFIEKRGI